MLGFMKIALAADLHFGLHACSEPYARSLASAMEGMTEWLGKNGVSRLLILGDLFDTRFAINQLAENQAMSCLEALEEGLTDMAVLLGNHDLYYASTVRINSARKFSRMARIVDSPAPLWDSVLAVPWICDGNREACLEAIESASLPWLAGHFDARGARMNNSRLSEEGLPLSLFRKFRAAFSGHFHSRQSLGSLQYIGSLVQTSFADIGEPRGFTVLDTETGEAEFIESKGMKHVSISLAEDFRPEDWDLKNCAVQMKVPASLWEDSRFVRKCEQAVMDAGCVYFAGSSLDMEASEKKLQDMPSMERSESLLSYMEKFAEKECEEPRQVVSELKRLHEAVRNP
jgi:DNA repair exonuclease SbcCD nuclease subunit